MYPWWKSHFAHEGMPARRISFLHHNLKNNFTSFSADLISFSVFFGLFDKSRDGKDGQSWRLSQRLSGGFQLVDLKLIKQMKYLMIADQEWLRETRYASQYPKVREHIIEQNRMKLNLFILSMVFAIT